MFSSFLFFLSLCCLYFKLILTLLNDQSPIPVTVYTITKKIIKLNFARPTGVHYNHCAAHIPSGTGY